MVSSEGREALHTIRLDRPGEAEPPTPRDAPTTQLAAEGYRRLGAIVAIVACATAVTSLIWIIEHLAGQHRNPWDLAGDCILSVGGLAFFLACKRSLFPSRAYVAVALVVEVLVAFDVGSGLMGWQYRAGDGLVAMQAGPDRTPHFELGAGEVPWTAIWILLFAAVIPLRPRTHLIGGLLSVSTLLFWPAISVMAQGMPPGLAGKEVEATSMVTMWLFSRGLLTTIVAYFAARSVYGLRKQLAEARRIGSYQLREKLGEGGMGEVWRADHHMLARPAAIKLIRTRPGGPSPGDDAVQRFEREVQAAAQLRSPHTIQIYDYGLTEDGTFYYVMELLDGFDLEVLVRRHGPLPWRRVLHVLKQACHSLAEAHERGLVHRDVKPANLSICRLGRDVDHVKVLDFGLVKATTAARPDPGLTQKGMFIGTPAYAAPEFATGNVNLADARSDLYSLGCVAFWLLTGTRPFDVPNPLEVLVLHAREAPRPPSACSELEMPEAVDRIVLACLEKDPARRPASAEVMGRLIAEAEGAEPWSRHEALAWWRQQGSSLRTS